MSKKRIRWLDLLDGLQLRARTHRRKYMCLRRGPEFVSSAPPDRWCMGFVRDRPFDGRPLHVLPVVDQLSRESPLI